MVTDLFRGASYLGSWVEMSYDASSIVNHNYRLVSLYWSICHKA